MILDQQEKACVRLFARWFEQNKHFCNRDDVLQALGLDQGGYEPLIKKMELLGVIERVLSTRAGYGVHFVVTAESVQVAREIDGQESEARTPPDIVDQLKKRARRNPWLARIIIVGLLLAFLLSLLNNMIAIIQKLSTCLH